MKKCINVNKPVTLHTLKELNDGSTNANLSQQEDGTTGETNNPPETKGFNWWFTKHIPFLKILEQVEINLENTRRR